MLFTVISILTIMVKGKPCSSHEGTVGRRMEFDDEYDTVEGMVAILKTSCMGVVRVGGVPPRFNTERQKQTWLRLRAKQDAKNKD
jgi:hypothetical protein